MINSNDVLGAEVTVHIQYDEKILDDEYKEAVIAKSEELGFEGQWGDYGYFNVTTEDPGKVKEILRIFGKW